MKGGLAALALSPSSGLSVVRMTAGANVSRLARRTLVSEQFETAMMDHVPNDAPLAVAPDGPSAWLTGGAPLGT